MFTEDVGPDEEVFVADGSLEQCGGGGGGGMMSGGIGRRWAVVEEIIPSLLY